MELETVSKSNTSVTPTLLNLCGRAAGAELSVTLTTRPDRREAVSMVTTYEVPGAYSRGACLAIYLHEEHSETPRILAGTRV